MKNCNKWMLFCVAIAIAIVFLLPKFGVAVAGASLLFPLLMIGCCVLPMFFMMKSSQGKEGGSCCSAKKGRTDQEHKEVAEDGKSSPGSCH